MKNKLSPSLKTTALAGILAASFISSSSASIIYQDTFARSGALAGSAPTVDNTGSSATWAATAGYICTGTNGLINNSVNGDYQGGAHLPLDWTGLYPDPKVQVDALVTGSFFALTLGDCDYWGYPSSTAMLKVYANGNVDVCHGPGWDGAFVKTNIVGGANAGQWNRLRIDYSNSLGTATFYVNGNQVAKDIPITSNTTGVGFNSDTGNNTLFTNLLVTFGSETVVPPSITGDLQGQTIFVGDPLRLSVTAGGTLPLTYTWRKNGANIPGPNAGLYVIPSPSVSDSANYSVVIANSAGSVTSAVVRADVHLEAQSTIVANNFDNSPSNAYDFTFSYSSDNTLVLPVTWTNLPAAGASGSTARVLYADGTDFANGSVTYSGFGGGWAQNFSPLPTHNLDFYQCDFKVRVENLNPGRTNTPGRLALRFFAPDGTTGVTNGSQDLIFSTENHYSFTSNFQSFSFILNTADFGGAAGQAAFNQYQSAINRVQFEFTADNFYTDFVNGPSDAIVIDDARLALRQSPAVSVTYNGTQPVLQWADPNVQLLGAANVTGPYSVVSATSPYPVPNGSPYHYFRTSFQAVP